MTTALSWYGGKHNLTPTLLKILENIPHDIYCEVFGGGGSIIFTKVPAKVNVYNDLSADLYNFMWVLRNAPEALTLALSLTPYSREEFSQPLDPQAAKVERARQFFVATQQSYSAKGQVAGWALGKTSRRTMSKQVSGWLRKIDDKLPQMVHAIREIQIEHLDFEACLDKYDSARTLFYLDPPYLPETRAAKHVYEHEMTLDDHRRLVDTLKTIVGKAVLSGYQNDLYDSLGWRQVSLGDQPLHATLGGTKNRKQEFVWIKT